MIFWLAGSIGTMFSGFLQAAAYTNLHGVHGRAGCEFNISLQIDTLNSHETTIFKGLGTGRRKEGADILM